MYLGHHHGFRRETGEPQLTFNYYRAFTDFIIRFVFGQGVHFRSPEATEAIIPDLLKRIWEVDNDKEKVLLEIGQLGGVSGDAFTKIAYEEPFLDPAGNYHAGRVRLLPLNPAFCMPVEDTEILTRRGWLSAYDLKTDDQVLSLDQDTDELVWADVEAVNVFNWDGEMHLWESERFSALSTPDHRWIHQTGRGKRSIRTSAEISSLKGRGGAQLVLAGGTPTHFPSEAKYSDDFVELVGWTVTEGALERGSSAIQITQSQRHNQEFCARIDRLHKSFEQTYTYHRDETDCTVWRFNSQVGQAVREVLGKNKGIKPEFLTALTYHQAALLYNTLMDGDGDTRRKRGEFFWQNNWEVMDSFQMLAMMLGKRSTGRMIKRDFGRYDEAKDSGTVSVYQNRTHGLADIKRSTVHYKGLVWCPTTSTGTWVARRKEVMQDGSGKKVIYLTGNCFP